VLEDRPLPPLPPTDDDDDDEEEEAENGHQPEPAVYVNSTNDSGLGGSSNAPQDYANTRIRTFEIVIERNGQILALKPARVSQKIQQVLLSLQVSFLLLFWSIRKSQIRCANHSHLAKFWVKYCQYSFFHSILFSLISHKLYFGSSNCSRAAYHQLLRANCLERSIFHQTKGLNIN
jgi:hypothetical protein